jgi:hypothetical protein
VHSHEIGTAIATGLKLAAAWTFPALVAAWDFIDLSARCALAAMAAGELDRRARVWSLQVD